MKKTLLKLLAMFSITVLLFAGCSGGAVDTGDTGTSTPPAASSGTANAGSDPAPAPASNYRVVFLCNGNLGDQGFFDSCNRGMEMMRDELGVEIKVIETGYDKTRWQPALEDVVDEQYDIIFVGTWEMVETLEKVAAENPQQRFILFDSSVDYSGGGYSNVYSMEYAYNEGSFLVGVIAGAATASGSMPHANAENVISFVGGIDSPVINDFLVGYIDGALYANPDVKVAVSYIGDFADSTRCKELALAQMDNLKSDVVYAAAGQAGLGALDAAKEGGVYALGMTDDMAEFYRETDPEKAELILSSMIGNTGLSLFNAMKKEIAGELPWGSSEIVGVADDAVGFANNDFYAKNVPQDVRDLVNQAKADMVSGKVTVRSALSMTAEEVTALVDSMRP